MIEKTPGTSQRVEKFRESILGPSNELPDNYDTPKIRYSHQILSVYDRKGQFHSQPFYAKTIAVGVLNLIPVCQDKNSMLNRFPKDHVLVRIGEFDEITGHIDALVTPEIVTEIEALLQLQNTEENRE